MSGVVSDEICSNLKYQKNSNVKKKSTKKEEPNKTCTRKSAFLNFCKENCFSRINEDQLKIFNELSDTGESF